MQIGKWEEEHGQRFLINGCHYMSVINHQWEAFRNAQKEQEKLDWVSNELLNDSILFNHCIIQYFIIT